MKKDKKVFEFKLFFILIELIAIIVSFGSSIYLENTLKTKVQYDSEYMDKLSYYEDNNFDIILSGASQKQIDEFKTKDFISNVVTATKVSINIKTTYNDDYNDILFFESENDLEYTEFNSKRLISSINTDKFIYADYKFCNLNKVNLGDSISVTLNGEYKDFIISRIYRTNYAYTKGVLIMNKKYLPIESKSQIVYLSTLNKTNLNLYLNDYKPMGTLIDKKDTQTDEEYQKYLDEFNSKNYSSFIIDLSSELEDVENNCLSKISTANKNFYISVAIVSILVFFTSFMSFFINAKNKKDKIYKYIQGNGNKNIVKLFSVFNISFILFMLIFSLLSVYISILNLTAFYTYSQAIISSYLCIILPIIGILISYIYTIIKIKKA